MKVFHKVGCLILIFWGIAAACMGPMNIQGVALTDDEKVDFAKIEALGTHGTEYLKEGDGTLLTYRYKSLTPHVMVYVANCLENLHYGGTIGFIGIKVDSLLFTQLEAAHFSTDIFDFTATLLIEIERMRRLEIISITDEKFMAIKTALEESKANGGMQYWTKQDECLAFNSWFNNNELVSVDGWDGIKGKQDEGDGCGGNVSFSLPTSNLEKPVSVVSTKQPTQAFMKTVISNSDISIHFANAVERSGTVHLYTALGKEILTRTLVKGSVKTSLNVDMAPGIYYLVAKIDGVVIDKTIRQ